MKTLSKVASMMLFGGALALTSGSLLAQDEALTLDSKSMFTAEEPIEIQIDDIDAPVTEENLEVDPDSVGTELLGLDAKHTYEVGTNSYRWVTVTVLFRTIVMQQCQRKYQVFSNNIYGSYYSDRHAHRHTGDRWRQVADSYCGR